MKPTQCHLWNAATLTDADLDFDFVHTYFEDEHLKRRLVKCKQCDQLYLKEFYEEIDWADGEDPQYVTYVPVKDRAEAEQILQEGRESLQSCTPSLHCDWPKNEDKKIFWTGKE